MTQSSLWSAGLDGPNPAYLRRQDSMMRDHSSLHHRPAHGPPVQGAGPRSFYRCCPTRGGLKAIPGDYCCRVCRVSQPSCRRGHHVPRPLPARSANRFSQEIDYERTRRSLQAGFFSFPSWP
jgi:hypothetical protein